MSPASPHLQLAVFLPEIAIARRGLDRLVVSIEGEPLKAEHARTIRQGKGSGRRARGGYRPNLALGAGHQHPRFLRQLLEAIGNRRARGKVGKALFWKADQLLAHGTLSFVAHTLEPHRLVTGIEFQCGSLPPPRGAEPYFARQNAAAERCTIAGTQRVEALKDPPVCGCARMFPVQARAR